LEPLINSPSPPQRVSPYGEGRANHDFRVAQLAQCTIRQRAQEPLEYAIADSVHEAPVVEVESSGDRYQARVALEQLADALSPTVGET
jgi:hypothetical protein